MHESSPAAKEIEKVWRAQHAKGAADRWSEEHVLSGSILNTWSNRLKQPEATPGPGAPSTLTPRVPPTNNTCFLCSQGAFQGGKQEGHFADNNFCA